MDRLLKKDFPVLDHGFVRPMDYMGTDASIADTARVSYQQGTRSVRDDAALIRYLLRNKHTSPFERCELVLYVQLPIVVARQWLRHRTASVNECSGRYSVLPSEFFVPGELHLQSTTNKQGRSDEQLPPEQTSELLSRMRDNCQESFEIYQQMLDAGVAREIARTCLPLGTYTQMIWKIDLHNLLHFLHLRLDDHAQEEIRAYASVIMDIVRTWVPVVARAFEDYVLGAKTFSKQELEVVRRMLRREEISRERSDLSPGEWRDLMKTLDVQALAWDAAPGAP